MQWTLRNLVLEHLAIACKNPAVRFFLGKATRG